ncbi:MAG: hypothetical protein U0894_12150 [Pirellulales bacterium]
MFSKEHHGQSGHHSIAEQSHDCGNVDIHLQQKMPIQTLNGKGIVDVNATAISAVRGAISFDFGHANLFGR